MTLLGPVDDKRRKAKSVLLTSFVVLIVLWIFKLSHPQISFFSSHTVPEPMTPEPVSVAKGKTGNQGSWEEVSSSDSSMDVFNGTITDKVAFLVETRFRSNIIPIILHFSSVLGPSWPLIGKNIPSHISSLFMAKCSIVYTSPEALGLYSTSAALARYTKTKKIQLRVVPQAVFFTDTDSFSRFLTEKWLYEDLAPAEHIFTFQTDSMICANAARSIEDFFEYDLVGAPIEASYGHGYNGGFSLRKRSTVMKVLEEWNWEDTKDESSHFEDQWFYNKFVPLSLDH